MNKNTRPPFTSLNPAGKHTKGRKVFQEQSARFCLGEAFISTLP